MTRHVLFVHGGGGGAHAADAKLVASLRKELGPAFTVRYPQMPDEEDPSYPVWKQLISQELASMGESPVLVGHSIGASVLIKFLVDGALDQAEAAVFLIATPFWHDDKVWNWKAVELPANASELLASGVSLFL